ncbi:hypothetical protein ACJZ2D_005869 [Fusarium nematophilum]
MVEPRYRDLKAKDIPHANIDNGKVLVKVISGQSGGVDSVKDLAYTPVWYLDVEILPGGKLVQPVPTGWNAFAYVFEGAADFVAGDGPPRGVKEFHAVTFESQGDAVSIEVPATADKSTRFLLIAGQILDQPIVQHGPFVLTSREEVEQAFEDFYESKNGFERGKGWQSENMKRRMSF